MPGKRSKKRKPTPSQSLKLRREPPSHAHTRAEFVRVMSALVRLRNQQSSLRRQADLAVRESEKRFRQVLETASEAVLEVDTAGHILLVNRAAEKMFGYARGELLKLNVEQLVPEDLRKAHAEHHARYTQKPATRPMGMGLELSARKKDGSTFPVEIGLSPNQTPQGLKIIVLVHDVSERKRMQDALRSSEDKLRQAEKLEALGRMAGGTAHEFNNLLTMLMGYASLMLSSLDSRETLVEYIGKINKSSKRAAEVTHQLLAFSRRQALALQSIDLNHLLAETCAVLPALVGSKIRVDFQRALEPVYIHADPSQIHQTLVNLALNARDAMAEGGKLTVKLGTRELTEKDLGRYPELLPGEYVELVVSDTGAGMGREIQARAFEPFFSTKAFGKGAGMGLAVIHGIIRQSGGSIAVESAPHKGTTFTIVLPRLSEPELGGGTGAVPIATTSRRTGTILLVEDEASLLELTRKFLQDTGYKVLDAGSGEAAIRIAEQFNERIDLLLTDVVLPGLNGRKTARRIKELRPGINVLYVSGYIHDAFEDDDAPLPPDNALLEKPFTFDQLAARVQAFFSQPKPQADSAAN